MRLSLEPGMMKLVKSYEPEKVSLKIDRLIKEAKG
jgi:hypothetical protein